jgi:hypothetical protein
MIDHLRKRLVGYADSLQKDLNRIQELVNNVRDLATTDDPKQAQALVLAMTKGKLADYWVKVPRQYSPEDIYLLAFNRFLEFAGVGEYDVVTAEDNEDVYLEMTQLKTETNFRFELAGNDGAFFVDKVSEERLFYWSPVRKEVFFNSSAMTNELVVRFKAADKASAIKTLSDLFLDFGRFMASELGYDVDLNMLESQDDYVYDLIPAAVPDVILDHLFVHSHGSQFFLKRVDQGAGIMLANNVEVRVFKSAGAGKGNAWHFQVTDGENAVSWLDVLLGYDFIADWYLAERETIEVADRITANVSVPTPVKVEVLAPRLA